MGGGTGTRARGFPTAKALHLAQFAEKKVEPNSGLGEAISYCLNRWERLALFLHQAGAPLDSNIVERALKNCILHRQNSLLYETENGAENGGSLHEPRLKSSLRRFLHARFRP